MYTTSHTQHARAQGGWGGTWTRWMKVATMMPYVTDRTDPMWDYGTCLHTHTNTHTADQWKKRKKMKLKRRRRSTGERRRRESVRGQIQILTEHRVRVSSLERETQLALGAELEHQALERDPEE